MEPQNPYPRPAMSNPLDFSLINEAFGYFKANPGPYIVASLATIVPVAITQGIGQAMQPTDPNQQLAFLPISFGLNMVGYFLAGPGYFGIAKSIVKARRGETVTTNDAMSGFAKILPLG